MSDFLWGQIFDSLLFLEPRKVMPLGRLEMKRNTAAASGSRA